MKSSTLLQPRADDPIAGALRGNGFIPIRPAASPAAAPKPSSRRARIWELAPTLHCSLIGTCLTTGELRALLRKLDASIAPGTSDHDLHTIAVGAVGMHSETAKHIQKALDRRHELPITRFGKVKNEEDLQRLWEDAVQGGEIPGAYWALITHPLATDALVRRAFGDVHMLSHFLGAANRADIRKLHQLEQMNAALEEKLARQQSQLRDGIGARDAKIHQLNAELARRVEHAQADKSTARTADASTLERLIADLRKELDREIVRRERAESRVRELTAARAAEAAGRSAAEGQLAELREELAAADAALDSSTPVEGESAPALNLAGRTILYVGGRGQQIAHLRSLVEQAGGTLLHHDGGLEQRGDLLAGLVSRADVALCPIDCVSHTAALTLKRLCRQSAKPFIPLRSSGTASLLRGLRAFESGTAPVDVG